MALGVCVSCMVDEFAFDDSQECRVLVKERIYVEYAVAGFRLGEGALRSLIYRFKYAGRKKVAYLLGSEIALRNDPPREVFSLVPVPIHRWRKVKRGYNQTEGIADGVARVWGVSVLKNVIVRREHTKTLTSAGRWQRADELKGVLDLGDQRPEGGVVLVDDVLTTGATLRACRDILENAKIEVIGVVVIAIA